MNTKDRSRVNIYFGVEAIVKESRHVVLDKLTRKPVGFWMYRNITEIRYIWSS